MIEFLIDFLLLVIHFFMVDFVLHIFFIVTMLCKHFYGSKFIWTLFVCSGFYVTTIDKPMLSLPITAFYLLLCTSVRWYGW